MPRIEVATTYKMETLRVMENGSAPRVYKRDAFIKDFTERFGGEVVKQVLCLGVPDAEVDTPITVSVTFQKKSGGKG